jgi:ABC-2 type transport system permease protein
MSVYLRSELRRTLRNRRVLVMSIALPVILLLVYGQLERGTINGADTAAYLMVSMAVFGSMSAAIGTGGQIATERGLGWNRTLRLTPLSPNQYVLTKVLLSMCLAVLPLVAVFSIGALVDHVRLAPGTWLLAALGCWLGALPFAALGLVIGYVARPDSVQQIGGLLYMLLSLFGGLWIPVEAMPHLMRLISQWTPAYWVAQLARAPIFPGNTVDWHTVLVVGLWTVGLAVIGLRRFQLDTARA